MSTKTEIRIYVASLSDYNNGILHGEWIDATQSAEEIQEAVTAMLANSPSAKEYGTPAEEWAIHDYEGFGKIKISEYESFETVAALAEAIEEHGEIFADFYSECASGTTVDSAVSDFQDRYRGKYRSIEEYAEEFIDECYSGSLKNIPDFIKYHIDYEGIGRDLELGGDISTIELDGKIHVFSN